MVLSIHSPTDARRNALFRWNRLSAEPLLTTVIDLYKYRAEIAFHHGLLIVLALVLLAAFMTVLCVVSFFQIGMALYRTVSFTRTQELNRKTFAMFRERGLVLWTPEDEAINGLASTLGLSGDIIPRLPRGHGSWWKRVLDSFKIPIRMVFNLVFAPAADVFIWQSVADRLQGSDYSGCELMMVSNSPCPQAGGWSALGTAIGKRLLAHANSFAAETLSRMRTTLGLALEGGHQRPNVLVGLRSQLTLEELIHTSYFRDTDVLAIISGWLTGVRDNRFNDSSLYVASDPGETATSVAHPVRRKRISLFPIVSAAVMVALFAFLCLLAQVYVVPHTEENLQRLALTQGGLSSSISSTIPRLRRLMGTTRTPLSVRSSAP